MKPTIKTMWLLFALGAIILPCIARADNIAIVIGVGEYANLPDATLPGIENDIAAISGALQQADFRIIRLWNGQATEANIRAAFAQAAQLVGPNDRFVYYQSSHGSRDYHLLTYDTTTNGDHLLSKADIRALMAQVRTRRKSLILDACFAGGFQERGGPFQQVKFYPIAALKEPPPQGIRDRTDTVVRNLEPDADLDVTRRDFVVFASSQDNQSSQVEQIDGAICSVFTHYLVQELNAHRHGAWNAVVQPTIAAVLRQTDNTQTPVFDSAFLPFIVFTTDRAAGEPGGGIMIPIGNLAQLYDINIVNSDRLALSARLDGDDPAEGEIYHPDTRVRLHLKVGTAGYLFVINRDDEDMAQLVGWDQSDPDLNDPARMVDQSRLADPDDFEFGKGGLKITTSHRKGIERWKAFLFTDRDDALQFARMWTALPADTNKRVRLNAFAKARLKQLTHIEVSSTDGGRALYTSEVHYRVTDR